MDSILESRTTGDNPDIIVKQKFGIIHKSYFTYTLDHNGRDTEISSVENDFDIQAQQVKERLGKKYDNYMDYSNEQDKTRLEAGVDENLLPMFNADALNMSQEQADRMQEDMERGAEHGNILWKTIISFSDEYLIEQGILSNKVERNLDQHRLKGAVQEQMKQYLKDEGIDQTAEWFGNIHLFGTENKEHIHVHLGIFEPGKSARPNKFNKLTNRNEPRGLFKQKSVDSFKAGLWRSTRRDEEREKMLEEQMAQSDPKRKLIDEFRKLDLLSEQRELFNQIIKALPEKKPLWRAKSNAEVMKEPNRLAEEYVDRYLLGQGKELYKGFLKSSNQLQERYIQAYGEDNDKAQGYTERREAELKQTLINSIYREAKAMTPDDFKKTRLAEIEDAGAAENILDIDKLNEKIKELKSQGKTVPPVLNQELEARKGMLVNDLKGARIQQSKTDLERLSLMEKEVNTDNDTDQDLLDFLISEKEDELEFHELGGDKNEWQYLVDNDGLNSEYLRRRIKLNANVPNIMTVSAITSQKKFVKNNKRRNQSELKLLKNASPEFIEKGYQMDSGKVRGLKEMERLQIELSENLLQNWSKAKDIDHSLSPEEIRELNSENQQLRSQFRKQRNQYLNWQENKPINSPRTDKIEVAGLYSKPNSQYNKGRRVKQSSLNRVNKRLGAELNRAKRSEDRALSAYERDQAMQAYEAQQENEYER